MQTLELKRKEKRRSRPGIAGIAETKRRREDNSSNLGRNKWF
jgi:hypothetical protein